jgi:hypothetical protein
MSDALTVFCAYVERVCAVQAADRGARDVPTMTFPSARGLGGASEPRLS